MKHPRIRVRRLIPLAFLLIPPLFWAIILTVAPTEWARNRVAEQLARSTGRSVQLGQLKIGACGGVTIAALEIGAPGSVGDPWLTVDSARINVSVLQLMAGQLEPTDVTVDGFALRVLRRRDGSLELADLLKPEPRDPSGSDPHESEPVELRLANGRITVIDESSANRLELAVTEGHATREGRLTTLHELRGTINTGPFSLAGSIDRSHAELPFHGTLHAEQMAIGQGTSLLAYLIPVLSGASETSSVDGQLTFNLSVSGQGMSRDVFRRTLAGKGSISLDPIAIEGSRLMAAVQDVIDLPANASVASVKSDFAIANGRVSTDNLTIGIGNVPVVFSGWTDFSGQLDYRVRADAMTARLPGKARELLSDLAIDVNDLSVLRITGTLDSMRVSAEAGPANPLAKRGNPSPKGDDRAKLRDLGRRLKERLLR